MTAPYPLRLPAAFATSAAIHAAVLALMLWSASSGLLDGAPEMPKAELIKVSLISRPGGGGGGALPGLPSAPKGQPGGEEPQARALPKVQLDSAPPPVPQPPTAVAKPVLPASRLPSPVHFPTVVAREAPKAQPQAATAPPNAAPTGAGSQVASLGTGDGTGGTGNGGGGEGTGDGSGGDGSDGLARPAHGANPKPPYPLAARRLGVEGVVMLEVLVRSDGRPAEVHVRTSSGSALLDDSAVETVRSRWRFIPARRGDSAVESRVTFPIRFRLDAG